MSNKGYIAVKADGTPVVDSYGYVLWFKSGEEAMTVEGSAKAKVLVRAKLPRRKKNENR